MSNTFLISDHHFSQASILHFMINDGSAKLRPEFQSVEEMDEFMIAQWNSVVGNNDRIYHLGDLCNHNRILDEILPRLNGRKVLVKGNHDQLKVSQYMKYFDDIRAIDRLDTFVICHVPIHPGSFGNKVTGCIHGHLHKYKVKDHEGNLDPRYYSVCVEHHNYTPVPFETIRKYYKELCNE